MFTNLNLTDLETADKMFRSRYVEIIDFTGETVRI
jgi:hypothetical protein